MHGICRIVLRLAVTCSLAAAPASAQIFVDAVNGNDSNAGGPTWSDAVQTIHTGIQKASPWAPMDRVLVAHGVYGPAQKNSIGVTIGQQIVLANKIHVHGGFQAGGSVLWYAPDGSFRRTIIKGPEINGNSTIIAPSAVLTEATLDGFLIKDGYSTNNGGAFSHLTDARVMLENLIFDGNTAQAHGGAIYCHGDELEIDRCTIVDNMAVRGAGVHIAEG